VLACVNSLVLSSQMSSKTRRVTSSPRLDELISYSPDPSAPTTPSPSSRGATLGVSSGIEVVGERAVAVQQQQLHHHRSLWRNNDILDMIWSFISHQDQLSCLALVCREWNQMSSQGGYGWNLAHTDSKPFDISHWCNRDPSPSIWLKLLHGRWKHIISLEISQPVRSTVTLFKNGQLVNLRHLHLSYEFTALDTLKMLPNLQSLSLSNIIALAQHDKWSGSSFHWSSLPLLTSLSLSSSGSCGPLLVIDNSAWTNINELSLHGLWSIAFHAPTPVLPSLSSLKLSTHYPRTLVPGDIIRLLTSSPALTSLTLSVIDANDISSLVPHMIMLKRLEICDIRYTLQPGESTAAAEQAVTSAFKLLSSLITPSTRMLTQQHPHHSGVQHMNTMDEVLQVPSTVTRDNELKILSSYHGEHKERPKPRVRGLVHLGLPSQFQTWAITTPIAQWDRLWSLIHGVSSFSIINNDDSDYRSVDNFIKWLTENVRNGKLPLLDTCYVKWRPSRFQLTRHQILNGSMLHFYKTLLAKPTHPLPSPSPSPSPSPLPSSSSSSSSWHNMTRSMISSSYNVTILDAIFSYFNASERLFNVEKVCRTWSHASKRNGCGWKVLQLLNILNDSRSFAWMYLCGDPRLSRIRHASLSEVEDDNPSMVYHRYIRGLHQWFPRLESFDLDVDGNSNPPAVGIGGVDLQPLSYCTNLTRASVGMNLLRVRPKTKAWTWRKLPPSLTNLQVYHYTTTTRLTSIALPVTWQQQLQALTLHDGWLPSTDEVKEPWLSLTSFCYGLADDVHETPDLYDRVVAAITPLFADRLPLLPNLLDLQLPHLDSNELIEAITTSSVKLNRIDLGHVSPLPLVRLSSLSSFGIWISRRSPKQDKNLVSANQLIDEIITVIPQLPSLTTLRLYGAPQPGHLIKLLQSLIPMGSSLELILDSGRKDSRTHIRDEWWRPIHASEFPALLNHLQQKRN
jgi:hypothetical protein